MSNSRDQAVAERADEVTSREDAGEFQQLKSRLEQIAAAVDGDDVSLDEALDLYEEAVGLGLQAINLLDVDITAQEEQQARMLEEGADALVDAPADAADVAVDAASAASSAESLDEAPQLAPDAGTATDESALAGN